MIDSDVEQDYRASAFDGATGGERIQAAVDAATAETDRAVVTVGPEGPDDGRWLLEETLILPSHTTLVLQNAHLRLTDGVGDNVIRNAAAVPGDGPQDHPGDGTDRDPGENETHVQPADPADRDRDVHVVGVGDAWIDGNAAAQHGVVVPLDAHQHDGSGRAFEAFRRNGIDLHRVDGFSIRNVTIGPTNAYAIAPEDVTNGLIANVTFRQDARTRNQDAVNVGGPAEDVHVENCRGTLGDGAITISSRGTATSHKTVLEGGDLRHVTVRNCQFVAARGEEHRWTGDGVEGTGKTIHNMAILHTWPHHEATLEHVRFANVSGRNMEVGAALRTGGGYVQDDNPFTTPGKHRDIVIDGVYAEGAPLFEAICDTDDLTIRDATVTGDPNQGNAICFDARGHRVGRLVLENCTVRPPANAEADAVVRLDGDVSRATIRDLTVDGDLSAPAPTAIDVPADATIDSLAVTNLSVENAVAGVAIDGDATVERAAFERADFTAVDVPWDGHERPGVTVDGVGVETSEAEWPSATEWATGDVVELRRPAGGVAGTFVLLPDERWCRLGGMES
jgi:hypothetical protein